MKNRNDKARKYLADKVNDARNAIYNHGMPIGGIAVQRLLRDTSSVPTSVRSLSCHVTYYPITNKHLVHLIIEHLYRMTWS